MTSDRDKVPGQADLEERDLFRILMDTVPDFIYFKDKSGRFLRISRALAKRYGLEEPEEALGKTDFDFYEPEHAKQFRASEEAVLATGEPLVGVDEHNVDRHGGSKWVSTTKVALRDVEGKIIGLLGITRDITARKDAEERLVRSEKMASLGRLTAGIAHEMNTPLAAARAALAEVDELLREMASSIGDADITAADQREIAAEMQGALGIANTAVERAVSFVRGMKTQTRDMARGERIRFDAVRVIGDALLLLRHDLRAKGCEASFDHPEGGVDLSGVPGRLQQVVSNLVGNAIDASPSGSTIRLNLTTREQGVELEISDSGSGISPENLPKIFEPMFTTKPFGVGTGLGLTIVHDIVTGELGGTIDVTSKPGEGTTFVLRFPLP
jgi:PAS domain S-box-containing protein